MAAVGWQLQLQDVITSRICTVVDRTCYLFLRTTQNPFSKVKFLFHKDTLIYWQAILDIVCIHLAQERYKQWQPVLNMVTTNLILYIFCTTAVYLQYLIPTCLTMFIYSSHIFWPLFLAIFMEFVVLVCAVYMSIYLVTVCIYDSNYN
jgi:hypothetical protein